MTEIKRLHRSDDEMVAGVCAGIADYLDLDPAAVRILAVLLTACTAGLAVIVYMMLWLVLQKREDAPAPIACAAYVPTSMAPGYGASFGLRPCEPCESSDEPCDDRDGMAGWSRVCVWVGSALLVLDAAFLVDVVVDGITWWSLWPIAIVLAGFIFMFVPSKYGSRARRFSGGLVLVSVGIVATFISIGALSPLSLSNAVAKLWPILLIVLGLFVMNASLHDDMFDFGVALCAIVVCVATCTAFAVPGPLEYVMIDLPFGLRAYDINPWL